MFNHYFHSKKVLVTGHTGFKGAWLCQWLLSLGAEVAGVSHEVPTNPALFGVLKLGDGVMDCRLDIRDYGALLGALEAFKPDIVFHLAAQAIVRTAFDDPVNTYSTNLMGTVHVLEAVKHVGSVQQLIMITSDKCYHNVEWCYGYREDDRLGGKDPYSASKACAEVAIQSYWHSYYKDSGVALASTRAGNVIGGGDWADSRIVPDCLRTWSQDRTMHLRSPDATRPWQHVLEPLSGYLWLAVMLNQNPALSGESFNFGPRSENNHTVAHLVKAMQAYWPGAIFTGNSTEKALGEAGLLKLNCDKALHHLDWAATCTFDETVQLTMDWYLAYYQRGEGMLDLSLKQIQQYQQWAGQRQKRWSGSEVLEDA